MDATELQKQLRGLFYLLEEGVMELQQTTAALKVKQQKIQQGLLDCELGIFSREEAALASLTPPPTPGSNSSHHRRERSPGPVTGAVAGRALPG